MLPILAYAISIDALVTILLQTPLMDVSATAWFGWLMP
jgi:hypothetical protein